MKLVLLDRDGVLNVDRPDSVKSPEELMMIPGSAQAVARLNAKGIRVAVVTNQAVVGRGTITHEELNQIHHRLRFCLKEAGAWVDDIFVCTDTDEVPSLRRKPAPGLLLEALNKYKAKAEETPMIGDALRDLQAAAALGCPRVLVLTGKGIVTQETGLPEAVHPVKIYPDLQAYVESLHI
ncbi:MAG: HAD-IIIA family hydrolase [Alphaproteobacteria bacterium]|nr:HAD-IIIA family hydrolase [Alphaproteobacteria bacterium]